MAPGALLAARDYSRSLVPRTFPTLRSPSSYLLNYKPKPGQNTVEDMEGKWVRLSDGRKILDASGGAGVLCIGSKDQRVISAINAQLQTGVAYAASLDFVTKPAGALEEYLADSTGRDLVHMNAVGSGSEAVEAAVKLSHQYHARLRGPNDPERTIIIARRQSYHGTTVGALDVGGHHARKLPYKSILPGNARLISPCYLYREGKGRTAEQYVEDLAKELEVEIQDAGPKKVAAMILEPVVGAALGSVAAMDGYLKAMQDVCRRHGILVILDEIMCGLGRTGSMHAYQQHEGVKPDILLLGKGLGGGYIGLSAMMVSQKISNTVQLKSRPSGFNHGHTFQDHAVGCAGALAVQDVIYSDKLIQNAGVRGLELERLLRDRLGDHEFIGEIRGVGLMWALEFVQDKVTKKPFDSKHKIAWKIHDLGLTKDHEIYTYLGTGSDDGVAGDHMMIMPALNVTSEELEMMVDRITKLVTIFFEDKDYTVPVSTL